MEVDKPVVIASVFYFSIVEEHAKIFYWYSRKSIPNQVAANVPRTCVAAVSFYRHCM